MSSRVGAELAERKQVESEPQENQALLQTMIENTPAAIAMFDIDMRYIAYSKRWLHDYHLGKRELKGLSHYAVFPEIGEDWKAVHRRCLAGATESREEDRFPRADGTEDIVRWVVQPWHKGDGNIGGIMMFTEVITERKRAEEEHRLLESELRQSQKMEALGTLAGGIAHDLNNLLAMIRTNAELGHSNLPEGHSARKFFDEVIMATTRAGDVVRQILLFGRRSETLRKTILVVPVVEDALRLLRATLPANIKFSATFESDIPPIFADASQIYQVIMNLGVNAAQAMKEGGVFSLSVNRVSVEDGSVSRSVDLQPADHIRITVGDTGIGMSRETLDRMFEPFFTTRAPEGTGLGLSVAHGIVKEHGGAILAESAPGQGSTFHVYFPVVKAIAPQEPDETAAISGRGEHIMYIDDERSLAVAIKRALEQMGYRCTAYSDPIEAVQAFNADPSMFDAVVTDMTMPAMSGWDVARALRSVRPNIPLAVTSGKSSGGSMEQLVLIGITTRIEKPTSLDQLGQAVHGLLHKAH